MGAVVPTTFGAGSGHMSQRVVVLGGGVAGLATALSVARSGHETVVVERDPMPPLRDGDDAFDDWARPDGVEPAHHRVVSGLIRLVHDTSATTDRLRGCRWRWLPVPPAATAPAGPDRERALAVVGAATREVA